MGFLGLVYRGLGTALPATNTDIILKLTGPNPWTQWPECHQMWPKIFPKSLKHLKMFLNLF